MEITVKFFSTLKALFGADKLTIDIPEGSSVNELFKILSDKFGDIHLDLEKFVVIVNQTSSTRNRILKDADTVILLEVMRGG